MKDRLSVGQALLRIFLITLLFSGSSLGFYYIYHKMRKSKSQDARYNITTIVQTGPQKEALKSLYLAELLELSSDKPCNLLNFDVKAGEQKLMLSPLIKEATIKKYEPCTIYIDYKIRQPLAWLADYENTAIDNDGYIFPIYPFLTPKELPEIFLGLPPFAEQAFGREGGRWQIALTDREAILALDILQLLRNQQICKFKIVRLDSSNAFSPKLGKREIVVEIENELLVKKEGKETLCVFPVFLRLSVKNFRQELGNFLVLNQKMMNDYADQIKGINFDLGIVRFKAKILDFRIPGVAYIGGGE